MRKIGIIGAGLGGLSAAIRLASNGFKVEVFESNSYPGGKASTLDCSGFRFDTGPSLLTMPFVIEDLFKSVGEEMGSYLKLNKMDVICKYFFHDSTVINAHSDIAQFSKEIENKTNDTSEAVIKYLSYCKNIYDLTSEIFLFNSPSEIKTFFNFKALKALLKISQIDPFRTMDASNRRFFKDERTIQLFNRYATYNGSDPYQAPATLNIIQHVEYNMGAYLPDKGVIAISDSLYKLAEKKGVRFRFKDKVNSILVKENKVCGLVTNTGEHKYDSVVSNVDVNTTFRNLLGDKTSSESKRYEKLEPSLSGIVFYWSINGSFPQLEVHNILFSKNYKKEFDDIFRSKVLPSDPTIYIYISSKYNQSDAPENCENWFVMINSPYIADQEWDNEIKLVRQKIIHKINSFLSVNIEEKIVCEKILTPSELQERTGSHLGSIYGISSNERKAAFLRQPNKSRSYKNLYFCGGSAHPGGGIPLVILSGKIVSDLITKDFN